MRSSLLIGEEPHNGGRFQVPINFRLEFAALLVVGPGLPMAHGLPGADHQVVIGIADRMQGFPGDISGLLHGQHPHLAQQTHDVAHMLAFNGPLQQHFDHKLLLLWGTLLHCTSVLKPFPP